LLCRQVPQAPFSQPLYVSEMFVHTSWCKGKKKADLNKTGRSGWIHFWDFLTFRMSLGSLNSLFVLKSHLQIIIKIKLKNGKNLDICRILAIFAAIFIHDK
jgi:hypothetical protein